MDISDYKPETQQYLSVLNPEQFDAVVHQGAPLLILAGAGSGKTRVITTKIAYLIGEKGIDPYSILAVTFTKKAANEMLERAIALEERSRFAQIRTFHSFGAWFLRTNAQYCNIDPNFTVYDDDDVITLITKACPGIARQQATHFAHKISLCKDYCLTPDDPEITDIESDPDFQRVYASYEKRLRETGNVDFGDLIMLPVLVMRKNEVVRHHIHNRFKVIMVDEYQDSNVAQFLLLQAISGVQEGNDSYVCVVGDDDQSIYKFRGAEVKNILTFKDKFEGTKLIRLERNYRSTAQILEIADRVVCNNSSRLGKNLKAERGEGKKPVLVFLPNQDEEAQFCADMVKMTHDKGVPYSEWAFLYRTNAQSLTFESEFLRRKIPYTVVGTLKFYEREEIKDVLAYISLIANSRDEIAFRRIVNKPVRGIGATSQDKLVEHSRSNIESNTYNLVETCRTVGPSMGKKQRDGLKSFVDVIDELTAFLGSDQNTDIKLSAFIEKVNEKSGLVEYHQTQDEISGTQRVANLQELANSAVLYQCNMQGLLEFLDHIELDRTLESEQDSEGGDKVTLITLHNTKGLEFDRVVITGMERGIFPRQDKTGDELEEERRLFYVGITRARNQLYMTCCAMRRMYGRTDYMDISPFLLEAGKENLKILGHVPNSFKYASGDGEFHGGDYGEKGLSHPELSSDPLIQKYHKGAKVYHDDYGYGIIIKGDESDDEFSEYVISVQFENSGIKKFIPKYQSKSLLVIKE